MDEMDEMEEEGRHGTTLEMFSNWRNADRPQADRRNLLWAWCCVVPRFLLRDASVTLNDDEAL